MQPSHPHQIQKLRIGYSLANVEREQSVPAQGNPWKKSFNSQPGLFLEVAPTHRMGVCVHVSQAGVGDPSAGAKESPGWTQRLPGSILGQP